MDHLKSSFFNQVAAPALEVFHFNAEDFRERPLSNFLWGITAYLVAFSPLRQGRKRLGINCHSEIARHCPSLTVLSLHSRGWYPYAPGLNADIFLLGFVKEGDFGHYLSTPAVHQSYWQH